MACLINTPIAFDRRHSGFQSLSVVDTTVLNQWEPLSATPLTIPLVNETTQQVGMITQVTFREAISAGTIRTNDVRLYVYNVQPANGTLGVVYVPATTGLIAMIDIATANYKRVNANCWQATLNDLNIDYESGTDATAVNLYIMALFNNATPSAAYDASVALSVDLFTVLAQTAD